ncbi:hypothetical protein CASFOL_004051 [Castilleja foliolosa]|uniref:Cycloidea-like protein n=1 Tax=Castilleja foliolosa TaxID=1961234 RepID=A0ABD3EMQ4_9LAMI
MFPSVNNSDGDENSLESLLLKRSFFSHQQNPNQEYDQNPPFFSNFPSPFFDEHELIMPLNQTLLQHYHNYPDPKPEVDLIKNDFNPAKTESTKRAITPTSSLKLKEKATEDHQPPLKRRNIGKRTGKKDRHSKIRTAQGIRDRRMRLSLQIARKFFDLQDMLGYDKASNTIEWLFSKSKTAIKELMTKAANNTTNTDLNFSVSDGKSESFISECEVVSGVEVSSNNEVIDKKLGQIPEKKPRKIARKPINNTIIRESREKARARARWRTREKMMSKLGFDQSNLISPNCYPADDKKLGFCNDQLGVVNQDVGTIEKLLGSSRLSSASNNFSPISDNYIDPSSNLMGFLGNLGDVEQW